MRVPKVQTIKAWHDALDFVENNKYAFVCMHTEMLIAIQTKKYEETAVKSYGIKGTNNRYLMHT